MNSINVYFSTSIKYIVWIGWYANHIGSNQCRSEALFLGFNLIFVFFFFFLSRFVLFEPTQLCTNSNTLENKQVVSIFEAMNLICLFFSLCQISNSWSILKSLHKSISTEYKSLKAQEPKYSLILFQFKITGQVDWNLKYVQLLMGIQNAKYRTDK